MDQKKESPLDRLVRMNASAANSSSVNAPMMTARKIEEAPKVEDEDEMSFSIKTEPKMIIEEKVAPKTIRNFSQVEKDLTDEDDELEIPAFIRRKMGK